MTGLSSRTLMYVHEGEARQLQSMGTNATSPCPFPRAQSRWGLVDSQKRFASQFSKVNPGTAQTYFQVQSGMNYLHFSVIYILLLCSVIPLSNDLYFTSR